MKIIGELSIQQGFISRWWCMAINKQQTMNSLHDWFAMFSIVHWHSYFFSLVKFLCFSRSDQKLLSTSRTGSTLFLHYSGDMIFMPEFLILEVRKSCMLSWQIHSGLPDVAIPLLFLLDLIGGWLPPLMDFPSRNVCRRDIIDGHFLMSFLSAPRTTLRTAAFVPDPIDFFV